MIRQFLSYLIHITIFASKEAKIAKDILDRKASIVAKIVSKSAAIPATFYGTCVTKLATGPALFLAIVRSKVLD